MGIRHELENMISFLLLISRQGKARLTKWYNPYTAKEKTNTVKEVTQLVLSRESKLCNFIEYKGYTLCYRRYASLYFVVCLDPYDNELIALELIHRYVECLETAYHILDELVIGGEMQETSKKAVLRVVAQQDALEE